MKIWRLLAVETAGFVITPLIVDPVDTVAVEKFWSLLAIVRVEEPPDAYNPRDLNVWAVPLTSLPLFKISSTS